MIHLRSKVHICIKLYLKNDSCNISLLPKAFSKIVSGFLLAALLIISMMVIQSCVGSPVVLSGSSKVKLGRPDA